MDWIAYLTVYRVRQQNTIYIYYYILYIRLVYYYKVMLHEVHCLLLQELDMLLKCTTCYMLHGVEREFYDLVNQCHMEGSLHPHNHSPQPTKTRHLPEFDKCPELCPPTRPIYLSPTWSAPPPSLASIVLSSLKRPS